MSSGAQTPAIEFDSTTATMFIGTLLKSLQRLSDGADHYAENLRYHYLKGQDRMSFPESTGLRYVVESGAGRTRAETNNPGTSGVGTA